MKPVDPKVQLVNSSLPQLYIHVNGKPVPVSGGDIMSPYLKKALMEYVQDLEEKMRKEKNVKRRSRMLKALYRAKMILRLEERRVRT